MAVYTKISAAQLSAFLREYERAGALERFEGIEQGVENTNYRVFTDRGRYVLTLFEGRTDPAALPFFFAFCGHLAEKGVRCPLPLRARSGRAVGELAGRPAALVSFLEGASVPEAGITDGHCAQVGALAAQMHLAALDFPQERANGMGISAWKKLAEKTKGRAGEVREGLADLIADELAFLENRLPAANLPRAAVHADIFPDNVFFDGGGGLSGIIDFYFSCTETLVYDLMIAANAWCFGTDGSFRPGRFRALLESYEAARPLSGAERESLGLMGRAAALRILSTRLHDLLFHDPRDFVRPHDPAPYVERLLFHRADGLIHES